MASLLYSAEEEEFDVPLPPKFPMATLSAQLREGLDKLSKQRAEEKFRRCEAFPEKRRNERSRKMLHGLSLSPLCPPSSSACEQPCLNASDAATNSGASPFSSMSPQTMLKVGCSSPGSSSKGSISLTGMPEDTVQFELELMEQFRNLFAFDRPSQANENRRGRFMAFDCYCNQDPEDVERLVAFANKWIPIDPKRRKIMEMEDNDDKNTS